ncbi:Fe2OG dioxygenase domain-containing protein [Psidium guajava]|nr:Fe2OG dioxygenase domain-containing protein [Psidium guajava]
MATSGSNCSIMSTAKSKDQEESPCTHRALLSSVSA